MVTDDDEPQARLSEEDQRERAQLILNAKISIAKQVLKLADDDAG